MEHIIHVLLVDPGLTNSNFQDTCLPLNIITLWVLNRIVLWQALRPWMLLVLQSWKEWKYMSFRTKSCYQVLIIIILVYKKQQTYYRDVDIFPMHALCNNSLCALACWFLLGIPIFLVSLFFIGSCLAFYISLRQLIYTTNHN